MRDPIESLEDFCGVQARSNVPTAIWSCSSGPSDNSSVVSQFPQPLAAHKWSRECSEGWWEWQQCVLCSEKAPLPIPQHTQSRKVFASSATINLQHAHTLDLS